MEPTEVAKSIPMTAWEQAVVVVLFIIFLACVFAFVRWLLGWVKGLQKEWQVFTDHQNKITRDWMDEQRKQDRSILMDIAEAVKEVGQQLRDHDEKVEERVERVECAAANRKRKAG